MADRLTQKIWFEDENGNKELYSPKNFQEYSSNLFSKEQIINKLGRLEDIMAKYGINSVEELDYNLEVFKKIRKLYGKLNQLNYKNKKDKYNWRKACELACENMKLPVDILIGNKEFNECHSIVEYFYQKAKKDVDNEKD